MINPDILFGRLGNRLFQMAYLYARMKEGVIPDLFLQDPKYFEKYSDDIKKLFGEGIGYLDQVGIHVRRGFNPLVPTEPKYNENPFYVDLFSTDYYEKAMAIFPNEKFLVFSDEPEWCKEKFKNNPNVQVMEKHDTIEDFNLLASCKGIIGANSSFSWWASYLCSMPNAKIVFPKKWYTDGIERTICPQNWIRL